MKIAVACDHGGLNLKKALIGYLVKNGYEYMDFGTNSTDSCDYPDYALPAAESVARGECDRGIVICSTGIGVSLSPTKYPECVVHIVTIPIVQNTPVITMTRICSLSAKVSGYRHDGGDCHRFSD